MGVNNNLSATHRETGTLPTFQKGGIIFFYHIYKTGGSTVGKMMHSMSMRRQNIHFTMIRKTVDWKNCLWALNMAEHDQKLVLLEFHVEYPAPTFPSLVEMAPIIERWRTEAHKRDLGFFAFTLVREPVAHAISFFNFFSVGMTAPSDTKEWNPFRTMAPTEKNLMHSFVGNRQCQMLGVDPESTASVPTDILRDPVHDNDGTSKVAPSERDDDLNYIRACEDEKVKNVLYHSLDWVGTTEKLQNETLPLLSKLILKDSRVGFNTTPFKVFSKNTRGIQGVSKKNLSYESLARIEKETELDRAIYNEVLQNNTLDNFGLDSSLRHKRTRNW